MNNFLRPTIVTIIIALMWFFTPLGKLPMAFIRQDKLIFNYIVIFFTILFISLIFFRSKIEKLSWVRLLLISVPVGHIFSVISIFLAEILLTDGLARFENTFRLTGYLKGVAWQLAFPFVLGGWLIVPLAVAMVKASKRFGS